jgi:uncharacterized integral membrane protein
MKASWFFVIFLLILVSVFSVQNADVMTVRFLPWEFTLSAALVIQLAAVLGALVGLVVGAYSRRKPAHTIVEERVPYPQPPPPPPPPAETDNDAPRLDTGR